MWLQAPDGSDDGGCTRWFPEHGRSGPHGGDAVHPEEGLLQTPPRNLSWATNSLPAVPDNTYDAITMSGILSRPCLSQRRIGTHCSPGGYVLLFR